MCALPSVAVTATTERIRGVMRVRANDSYTNALRQAHLRPYILPVLGPEDARLMLEGMDGLLLTGGEDVDPAHYHQSAVPQIGELHPARDAFELALVAAAHELRIPTLAICRGIQVANVALGGSLVQDIPSQIVGALDHDAGSERDARAHDISITPGSMLHRAIGVVRISANSFHHQAVDRAADGLTITARAPDGVVEGAEWTGGDWWLLAVQWHPEELTQTPEPHDRNLFRAFSERLG